MFAVFHPMIGGDGRIGQGAIVIGIPSDDVKIMVKRLRQIHQRANWSARLKSGKEPIGKDQYFFSSVCHVASPNGPAQPVAICVTR